MIVSPIVARKYDYPPFIPLHTELLRAGASLTAAAVYGYYELAVKQKGNSSIASSLAVECPNRHVSKALKLSPA